MIPPGVLYLNSFCKARPVPPGAYPQPSSEDRWPRRLVRAALMGPTQLPSHGVAGPSGQHPIPPSKNEVSLW